MRCWPTGKIVEPGAAADRRGIPVSRGMLSLPPRRLLSLVVRVRHEGVAETVLLFWKEVTTPAVLPAVCYRGVLARQRAGAEPSA